MMMALCALVLTVRELTLIKGGCVLTIEVIAIILLELGAISKWKIA
jgi:hypothetical protein